MQSSIVSTVARRAPSVAIYSLGQFEVLIQGISVRMDGRGPKKPLELLSILIVAGARGAVVGTVADDLWPEADGFDAYRSLITTIYRLRRLLADRDTVHLGAGRIRLDPTLCQVDVWQFENALSAARDREQLRAALAIYEGPFLEGSDNPWVVGMRIRLQHAITHAVRTIGSSLPGATGADTLEVVGSVRASGLSRGDRRSGAAVRLLVQGDPVVRHELQPRGK
jgi:LuxR family transcriptional regulator, maltose regulon positive regulatory protein